jgi:hypothetical protein
LLMFSFELGEIFGEASPASSRAEPNNIKN